MDIDFVILWVDGSDPDWRARMEFFRARDISDGRLPEQFPEASNDNRYCELGTLRYLLRSIEKFCPWYRYVHLVVEGHIPDWLNTMHPKLKIVRHEDIFPDPSHLPTFNVHAIHMHLHRIPGLAEQFVLCDDDFLVMKALEPDAFFVNGVPRDFFVLEQQRQPVFVWDHNFEATVAALHRQLPLWRHAGSLFYRGQTKPQFAQNLYYLLKGRFRLRRFRWSHFCQPYLKSTIESCWRLFHEEMQQTSRCRFREAANVSQYLFRGYQLLTGAFVPCADPRGHMISLGNDPDVNQRRMFALLGTEAEFGCITESVNLAMREHQKDITDLISRWLQYRLPEASGFESDRDDVICPSAGRSARW